MCLCWSFNGPEPGGPESKGEKEADVPWFTRKANRALFLGLALLQVGTGRPLEWVKVQCAFSRGSQKPGQESELSGPLCSKELARNRERERKNRKKEEKKDTGTKALTEQRCFNQHGMGIYTVVILSKDKG